MSSVTPAVPGEAAGAVPSAPEASPEATASSASAEASTSASAPASASASASTSGSSSPLDPEAAKTAAGKLRNKGLAAAGKLRFQYSLSAAELATALAVFQMLDFNNDGASLRLTRQSITFWQAMHDLQQCCSAHYSC